LVVIFIYKVVSKQFLSASVLDDLHATFRWYLLLETRKLCPTSFAIFRSIYYYGWSSLDGIVRSMDNDSGKPNNAWQNPPILP